MYYFLCLLLLSTISQLGGFPLWLTIPIWCAATLVGYLVLASASTHIFMPATPRDEDDNVDQMINEFLLKAIRSYPFFLLVFFVLTAAITCTLLYFFLPAEFLWIWLSYLLISVPCMYLSKSCNSAWEKALFWIAILATLVAMLLHVGFRTLVNLLDDYFDNPFVTHVWRMTEELNDYWFYD